ncbi:MAG: ABC transporter permease, partial [Acidobacteriota bacterium]
MLHDLRLAVASLRREGLLSVLVVLILAASLGVHTAVFSLVNAAFFRPLPYADAERLMVVESVSAKTGGAYGLSVSDADDYRAEARLLDAVGAFTARRDNLISRDDRVTSVPSALVTSGVLEATGVEPVIGRLFTAEDDSQGGDSFNVVLGHGLWRSRFGGDAVELGLGGVDAHRRGEACKALGPAHGALVVAGVAGVLGVDPALVRKPQLGAFGETEARRQHADH